MKLLGVIASPFVRKVCVTLLEYGLPFEFAVMIPADDNTELPALSPLSKIPLLITDDGEPLMDSGLIIEYLDGLVPGPKLTPESWPDRIAVKRWVTLADGISEAGVLISAEMMFRQPEMRSDYWVERQRAKIKRTIAVLAREIGNREWFYGSRLTLADLAAGCALSYIGYRHSDILWRDEHANLDNYERRLAARDSFVRTRAAPG